jgi:hypothetical protein
MHLEMGFQMQFKLSLMKQAKTMRNHNRIAIFIFISFFSFCVLHVFLRNNDLKRNGILLTGKILSHTFTAKSSVMRFKYEFTYNGKIFISDSPAGVTNSSQFINKTFPVRFSPKSEESEILITPGDFRKYGLGFPDSLEWIKKYII